MKKTPHGTMSEYIKKTRNKRIRPLIEFSPWEGGFTRVGIEILFQNGRRRIVLHMHGLLEGQRDLLLLKWKICSWIVRGVEVE